MLLSTGRVGYGKELNYPGCLGQCMVGRVSYMGRVKQGNYHTHVLYTIPNPNYTLPKPYPFIITYPIHHPTFGYPDWESVNLCKYQHYPTLDTYLSLSFHSDTLPEYLPYPTNRRKIPLRTLSIYPTYPIHVTSAYIPVPTSHYLLLHTPVCISLLYTIARA